MQISKGVIGGDLAACVILYNPDSDVVDNVSSYAKHVAVVYAVDNGNGTDVIKQLQAQYDNIVELKNPENMGIAYSLNRVLDMVKDKYQYLLTMDQDSHFTEQGISSYVEESNKVDWQYTLGLSPSIVSYDFVDFDYSGVQWKEKLCVITSGNIISVAHALEIGGFDEDLFIDEVDFEFCYRGLLRGYKFFSATKSVYLQHRLGNPKLVKILGMKFYPPMHNYVRTYYIYRNRWYVYWKYHNIDEKFFFKCYIVSSFRWFISKLLFEEDSARKMKSIFLGIWDAINHNMGKKNFDY